MSRERESGHEATPTSAMDESLIEAMLALSPEERVRHSERMVRTIELLLEGMEAAEVDRVLEAMLQRRS
jgi:hypothetical protein